MPSKKTEIIDFEGLNTGQHGDIKYYNGKNWVRLNPGLQGSILSLSDVGGGFLEPRWATQAEIWYEPGNTWFLGLFSGSITYYQTTDYSGTDPTEAANATWEAVDGSNPVPNISFNGTDFTISGAGFFPVNGTYSPSGTHEGVPVYGGPYVFEIGYNPDPSSSSSSSSSSSNSDISSSSNSDISSSSNSDISSSSSSDISSSSSSSSDISSSSSSSSSILMISKWNANDATLSLYNDSLKSYWGLNSKEEYINNNNLTTWNGSWDSFVNTYNYLSKHFRAFSIQNNYQEYAKAPITENLKPTNSCAYSFWLKPHSQPFVDYNHFYLYTHTTAPYHANIGLKYEVFNSSSSSSSNSSKIYVIHRQSNDVYVEPGFDQVLSNDIWHHICVVHYGNEIRLYVNNIKLSSEDSTTYDGTIKTDDGMVDLGGINGCEWQEKFDGMFDEVAFWKDIDFANESDIDLFVSSLYNSGNGAFWNEYYSNNFLKVIPNEDYGITGLGIETIGGFGNSISIDGDYFIVGASRTDVNYGLNGVAYIFKYNGTNWNAIKSLIAPRAWNAEFMGKSVSIEGDYAVSGSPGQETFDPSGAFYHGSAFVYKKNEGGTDNWGQIKELIASDAVHQGEFGKSVAQSGDFIFVGSIKNSTEDVGSVYVFKKDEGGTDSWGELTKITPSDVTTYRYHFANSLDADGDYLVISDQNQNSNAGAVYVFKYNGTNNWDQIAKLTASDASSGDQFGDEVLINGNYIVVGAPYKDSWGVKAGAVYIYKNDGSDNWSQIAKLTASDSSSEDYFGRGLALSGDYLIVGAVNSDTTPQYYGGTNSGTIYIFKNDGLDNWEEIKKTYPSAIVKGDNFGRGLASDNDKTIIGAINDTSVSINALESGACYIIDNSYLFSISSSSAISPITETQEIKASDGAAHDLFGYSCDAYGDDMIIGAIHKNIGSPGYPYTEAGAAYIYKKNGESWNEVQKLLSSDIQDTDEFGSSVSIKGNYAIVGAIAKDGFTGAAYIFKYNGASWNEIVKLTASDASSSSEFGCSVSIHDNYAIVGAFGDNSYAGAVYVFYKDEGGIDNWGQIAKLTASDSAINSSFGFSVDIFGSYCVVGALGHDGGGDDAGAAYVFYRDQGGFNNWGEVKKITSLDLEAGDTFGDSVSIYDSMIVVGAPRKGDGVSTGAAYVFYRDQGGFNNWGPIRKLTSPDPTGFQDYFGCSVSILDGYIAIGSYVRGNYDGAIYIYYQNKGKDDNWEFYKKLKSNLSDVRLGWSTAIASTYTDVTIIGGGPNATTSLGSGSGAAYVFNVDKY